MMDDTQMNPNDDGMNPATAPTGDEGSKEQTSDTAPAETSAPAEETPQQG